MRDCIIWHVSVGETFSHAGLKCEIWNMKESGMPEMWGKKRRYVENRTYVGTTILQIRDQNEVDTHVCFV